MENKKEEGFSYTSPELQRKNALKVLGIEAIVIVVVVVVVLAFLNYFGIFKISDIVKQFQPSEKANIQIQNNKKSNPPLTPIVDKNAKPIVKAVSDIPGYTVTLENSDKLMQLLNSWGTFNKEYQTRYGAEGQTLGTPLKLIIVHLTDKKQRTNYFGPDVNNPMSSSLTRVTPGKFDMYIYVEPSILEKNSLQTPPGRLLGSEFLTSLYKIVNVAQTPEEARKVAERVNSDFQTNPLMRTEYFKIEKK